MSTRRYVVGPAKDIPPGGRRIVTVAGRTIGVFNVGGRFHALKNSCPHTQAPVCLGEVTGMPLPTAPGQFAWGKEGEVLRCPWHGWEFDITTGESVFDPDTRIVTYPARVEDGAVVVEI